MTETDQERTAREWLNALGAEKDADTAVAEAMSKLDAARANTLKAYEAMKLAFSAEPPKPAIEDRTAFAAQFDTFRERLNTETDETFNDSYGFTGLGQTSDPIRHDPD